MNATPSARQLEYQLWERGVFLHFGLRTFYEGWVDFDPRAMDPTRFDPQALDCEQWARTIKKAGFRYVVMTAKHHDGFALWPSATTHFSVASSPWRNGQGDVVREFVQACRKHGLAFGLYYSPYDASCPVYDNPTAYDDYFITQVAELLEPYGPIDILWFDGCGSEEHTYDWKRIVGEIRRMQPDILLFEQGDPDFRWVGNEDGLAPLDISSITTRDGRQVWLPAECDMRMREHNWFYSDEDVNTIKSVKELMGIYQLSCGRGCNLLLNIGPDRRGLLPEADSQRLVAFGQEITRQYGHPLSCISDALSSAKKLSWELPTPALVDRVFLSEDVALGEHVKHFAIYCESLNSHMPITLTEGNHIGIRRICHFPPVRTAKVWIDFESTDAPALAIANLYAVNG